MVSFGGSQSYNAFNLAGFSQDVDSFEQALTDFGDAYEANPQQINVSKEFESLIKLFQGLWNQAQQLPYPEARSEYNARLTKIHKYLKTKNLNNFEKISDLVGDFKNYNRTASQLFPAVVTPSDKSKPRIQELSLQGPSPANQSSLSSRMITQYSNATTTISNASSNTNRSTMSSSSSSTRAALSQEVLRLQEVERKYLHAESASNRNQMLLLNSIGLLSNAVSFSTLLQNKEMEIQYLDLLNEVAGNENPTLWNKFVKDSSKLFLRDIYTYIIKDSSSKYLSSALHEKLFSEFMLSNWPIDDELLTTIVKKEYTIETHRIKLFDFSQGLFGLSLVYMNNPEIFGDECITYKEVLLVKMLVGISDGLIQKDVFARFYNFLEAQHALQFSWDKLTTPQREKILDQVINNSNFMGTSISLGLSMDAAIFISCSNEYSNKEEKEIVENSNIEKERYYSLMLKLDRMKECPASMLPGLLKFLGDNLFKYHSEKVLDDLLFLLKKNNLVFHPRWLFYAFSSLGQFVNKRDKGDFLSYLKSELPHYYDQAISYLDNMQIEKKSTTGTLFFKCCEKDYKSITEKEKIQFFFLMIKFKNFKIISINNRQVIEDLLNYLKNNICKDFSNMKPVFAFISKFTGLKPLGIIQILQKQYGNRIDIEKAKEIFGDCLNCKELLKWFSTLSPKDFSDQNLTLIAANVCALATTEKSWVKGKDEELACDVFARMNVSLLPDNVFMDLCCSGGPLHDIVKTNPDLCLKTASETQLEKYYMASESNLRFNDKHYEAEHSSEVPPLPEGTYVNYNELIQMFRALNFTDSTNTETYCDPKQLIDQDSVMSVYRAEEGLQSLISKLQNPNGPSYCPKDNMQRKQWMQNLERWMGHSIIALRQKPVLQQFYCLRDLASAGLHCGGYIYPVAQELYHQLTEATAPTLAIKVSTILAQRRFKILEAEFEKRAGKESQSSHIKNYSMKETGKPFGVYDWKAYSFFDDEYIRRMTEDGVGVVYYYGPRKLCTSREQEQLLTACKRAYNPTLAINEIVKHFNGIAGHPPTIGSNSPFRAEQFEPWFKNNMPKKFQVDFLRNRAEHVLEKDKEELKEKAALSVDEKLINDAIRKAYQFIKTTEIDLNNIPSESLNIEIVTFLIKWKEKNSEIDLHSIITEASTYFTPEKKSEIAKTLAIEEVKAKNRDKALNLQKLEKMTEAEQEAMYQKAYRESLFNSDEYNAAVLSEIYYVDPISTQRIIKREWIIYMLQTLSSKENHNVFEEIRGMVSKDDYKNDSERVELSRPYIELNPEDMYLSMPDNRYR